MISKTVIPRLLCVLGLVLLAGCSSDDGTTLVPPGDVEPEVHFDDSVTARVLYSRFDSLEATRVPSNVEIGFEGTDADAADLRPAKYRYLMIPAVWEESAILVRDQYNRLYQNIVAWDHPSWTEWRAYPVEATDRIVSFQDLEIGDCFLFAVQMMNADGGVSEGRNYTVEVMHLIVTGGWSPE